MKKSFYFRAFLYCTVIVLLSVSLTGCKKKSDLRKAADKQGILIGTAVATDQLEDPKYYKTLAENFNVVTAENIMKWETIHPRRDTYDFTESDKLVKFAKKHNMKVRGHTLVWHNQNPNWLLSQPWDKDDLWKVLEDHIKTVVTHYKGDIYAWDVVNEALDEEDYRETFWYLYLGPEYIEKAFRWAHEADPDALLFYNDYSNEEINDKSNRMYSMVKKLLDDGVPIHGVGLQGHLSLEYGFDFEGLYMNVIRFAELGLKVDFTEIDIRIKKPESEADFKEQAVRYRKLMEIMLAIENANSFTVWGVSDAHSWVPQFFQGTDSALLFDREMEPKLAYHTLVETLEKGPVKLNYSKNFADKFRSRKAIPPFKAHAVNSAPKIDGTPNDKEWAKGVTYPITFNQLNLYDFRTPPHDDLWGEWTVVYRGNTIYGIIRRHDDKDRTDHKLDYENDNIEVFFHLGDIFAQLRSIVGQGWEPNSYEGERNIAWNKEGTVCEYSVTLPESDLTGLIAGWNISLSDNDGKDNRDHQLYPITGQNDGWQGKNLGTIQFVGNSPRVPEKSRVVMPFIAAAASDTPEIDGTFSEDEWMDAIKYQFAYNQLDSMNQSVGFNNNAISGSWGIVRKDNFLYGFVLRKDAKTVTSNDDPELNDNVAVYLEIEDGTAVVFRSVVGKDWESPALSGSHKAQWSSDGSVLEFVIELPEEAASRKMLGFNISLSDNDGGDKLDYKLYSITGENKSSEAKGLAELELQL
ncbi:MAG: endo-1,4-beta-xylanase [Spirochaetes bacterium]|nr:endo-1,4-beta-xylanase [Spirochaetota bacterium]